MGAKNREFHTTSSGKHSLSHSFVSAQRGVSDETSSGRLILVNPGMSFAATLSIMRDHLLFYEELFFLLLVVPFLLGFAQPPTIDVSKPVGGNTWIVGPEGDFKTIEDADSSDEVKPGDIIRVKAGTYSMRSFNKSGTKGHEIVWEPYGDGMVTVRMQSDRIQVVGSYIIIDGGPKKQITLDGGDACTSNCLTLYIYNWVEDNTNVTVRRCVIQKIAGSLQADNGGGSALIVKSNNFRFYNNEVKNSSGAGIYIRWGQNIEIRNNYFHDLKSTAIQLNPHDGAIADEVYISGNLITNVGRGRPKYGMALLSSTDLAYDIYVYNNIIWESYGGIKIFPYSNMNMRIYHNTAYNNDQRGLWKNTGDAQSMKILNNISWANGSSDTFEKGTLIESNNLLNNGSDPKFISTNPRDMNYLQLAPNSPAIDAGKDLSSDQVNSDFLGVPRRQGDGYDIGAYECLEGGTPVLRITTESLPDGVENEPYHVSLAATGGTPPYTWTIQDGELPSGVSLSSLGVISGSPESAGTFDATIRVSDGDSTTTSKTYSVIIHDEAGIKSPAAPANVRMDTTQ
jgi:parallel beta-helix repeat protein